MTKDKKIDKDKLIKANWDLLMLIHIIGTDVAIQTQLRELCIKLGIVNTKETFNRRIRLLEDAKLIGRVKFFTTTNNKLIYLNRLVRARLMQRNYKSVKDFYKKDKKTNEIIITDYKAKLSMLRFEWLDLFVNKMIDEGCLFEDNIDLEDLYINLYGRTMVKYRQSNGYGLLLDLDGKIKALNDSSVAKVEKEIIDDINRLNKDISDLDKSIELMQRSKNMLAKGQFDKSVVDRVKKEIEEQEPVLKALIEKRNNYVNGRKFLEDDLKSLPDSPYKYIQLSEHGKDLLSYMCSSRESRVNNFNTDISRDNNVERMLSFDTLLSRDIIIELNGVNEKGQHKFLCYLLDVSNDMDYDKVGMYIGETINLIKDCYGASIELDKENRIYGLNEVECNLEFEFKILFWTKEKLDRYAKLSKERGLVRRTKKRKEYSNLTNVLIRYLDVNEVSSIRVGYVNLDLKNKYYNEKRLSVANSKYKI